jgi:hypothetical protein
MSAPAPPVTSRRILFDQSGLSSYQPDRRAGLTEDGPGAKPCGSVSWLPLVLTWSVHSSPFQ